MMTATKVRNLPLVLDTPRHSAPSTNVVEGLIVLKNFDFEQKRQISDRYRASAKFGREVQPK